MLNRIVSGLALAGLIGVAVPTATHHSPGLVNVHEWGTFTTVAGPDGRAIEWLPLNGPTDLPCFVDHFGSQVYKIALANGSPDVYDYEILKSRMSGKVRMETPVLYFYTDRAQSVRVEVGFPRGVMTEWYPKATVQQPSIAANGLRDEKLVSTIVWPSVKLAPGTSPAYPVSAGNSHYYAARQTDATPLSVGNQTEKFLFYRGVAGFDVPISVVALAEGGVRISNLAPTPITNVVLFENYGGRIGFRVSGALRSDITLDDPPLTGDFNALRTELERMLVGAGLFEKEARAMVETWRDSWFEEGTRVFYIVPPSTVNAMLPLKVTPEPAQVRRVFVGRMEVMNILTGNAVDAAIKHNDTAALQQFARFLGPITDRYQTNPARSAQVKQVTNVALASYVARSSSCPAAH